jgi:hypothetical protein
MEERSMTRPPREEEAPAVEWPPPRTARSRVCEEAYFSAEAIRVEDWGRMTAPYMVKMLVNVSRGVNWLASFMVREVAEQACRK